jgi:hypothetical protein
MAKATEQSKEIMMNSQGKGTISLRSAKTTKESFKRQITMKQPLPQE